jgi:4'-phosphopantetheinyl transferase EntD
VTRLAIVAEDARRGMPHAIGVGIRRTTSGEPVPRLEPEEEQLLGPRAAQRRRVHFALGRAAARDALAELGMEPAPIGRGAGGEPLWPDGIVGTISHSGDMAMAIVGRESHYAGLGMDVEQLAPGLSARATRLVCTPAERAWLPMGPDVWRTMLFSAKEAVFKALFPIEQVYLGFGDAELTWLPDICAFEARLLKNAGAAHPVDSALRVYCTLAEREVLSVTYALAAR